MRVLVTGATGFIGSHCIEALSDIPEIEIIAACRDISKLPSGFRGETRVGDLMEHENVNRVVKSVDVIIHTAAWTSLWGHKKESEAFFLNPSLALINSAYKQGVKRFIFISTVSAAAPKNASDPLSRGTKRSYWPHEANVVTIEEHLRELASDTFCAINLRAGLFAGSRFALGLLPILVPRLKTHLVPWVSAGRTGMTITDGRDIGQCAALATTAPKMKGYEGFNVVGPEVPRVKDVIKHLHQQHGLPLPHFSVSFPIAFAFAWLMEKLDPLVPWEPLVTRSIIHLMQETDADNTLAEQKLGYRPNHHWKDAIDLQLAEMAEVQSETMSMARPLPDGSRR
ncbi:MAG: NAD(P)-dependent oxidoreductase [Candidatus Thiodiazotropha sp. L084R]